MAQSVRVEFVSLGKGGDASPSNIIRSNAPPVGLTLAVTTTATAALSRPKVPNGGEWGGAVRLTAIGFPVYVSWAGDATLINSLRLPVDAPEMFYLKDGTELSFLAEQA